MYRCTSWTPRAITFTSPRRVSASTQCLADTLQPQGRPQHHRHNERGLHYLTSTSTFISPLTFAARRTSAFQTANFLNLTLTSDLRLFSTKNSQHVRSLSNVRANRVPCLGVNKSVDIFPVRGHSSQSKTIATDSNSVGRTAIEAEQEAKTKEFTQHKAKSRLLTQTSGLFDDHRQSYGIKPAFAVIKALTFFFLCRFDLFTKNAEKIMQIARRLLGRRVADALIRAMVYDQFVVEPEPEAISRAVLDLGKHGVGVLLAVPIEDDAGAHKVDEAFLDRNLAMIVECVSIASQVFEADPLVQFRVTALMSGTLAKVVAKMSSKCVAPDTSFHGNPDLPISLDTIDAMVKAMSGEGFDFLQIPGWSDFPPEKIDEFKRALGRFGTLAKSLKEADMTAMIDAEYTYMNPALRHLVFALMEICNKDKPRVFYTYQAYLKSTFGMLSKDLALAQSRGTCFGVKLVRGAYMVKERQLAVDQGYDDPVNDTFDATSDSYHRCLDLLLTTARKDEKAVRFILASHNEDTLYFAFRRMDELGLSPQSPAIIFGQLYGMADHISYVLGASGCRVVKSVPYGSMDDTIPYLARRAQENKSVLLNARKERTMLRRSLADKLMGR